MNEYDGGQNARLVPEEDRNDKKRSKSWRTIRQKLAKKNIVDLIFKVLENAGKAA